MYIGTEARGVSNRIAISRPNRIDAFGITGAALGVIVSAYILFFLEITIRSGSGGGATSQGGSAQGGSTSTSETVFEGVVSVFQSGASSDPALLIWPAIIAVVAVIGGIAVWKRHWIGAAASAVVLATIALFGKFTIGLFAAPSAAALALGAALVYRENTADSQATPDHRGGLGEILFGRYVLALFVLFAGPLLLAGLFDVEFVLVSVLAIPGYVIFSVLLAVRSAAGLENVVGVTAIYGIHVLWSYVVALGIVTAVRKLVRGGRDN